MTILNQASDGSLSLLVALWKALRTCGPIDKRRLLALCFPDSLASSDNSQSQISKTLGQWTKLGVFGRDNNGTISLLDPFDAIPPEDLDSFRSCLLPLTFPRPTEKAVEDSSGSGPAMDFVEATSWLLMQDPFSFSGKWDQVERLETEQGTRFFSNRGRWAGFVAWGPFLGVVLRGSRAELVLNPVNSIRKTLPTLVEGADLHSGEGVSVDVILACLSAQFPFLQGGYVWNSVSASLRQPPIRIDGNSISPCLSLALLQMEHEGELVLRDQSDAPVRKWLLGHGGRRLVNITHVEVGQKR